MSIRPILAIYLCLICLSLRAALPPSVYEEFRAKAPEAIRFEATEVKHEITKGDDLNTTIVHSTLKVISVKRSATKLKKGALIKVFYTVIEDLAPDATGANETIITRGLKGLAWLKIQQDGTYGLAAEGSSIQTESSATAP